VWRKHWGNGTIAPCVVLVGFTSPHSFTMRKIPLLARMNNQALCRCDEPSGVWLASRAPESVWTANRRKFQIPLTLLFEFLWGAERSHKLHRAEENDLNDQNKNADGRRLSLVVDMILLFMSNLPRVFVTNILLLALLRVNGSSTTRSSSNDAADDLKRPKQFDPGFCDDPCVPGSEEIMSIKEHGTSHNPVQSSLRWSQTWSIADRICNFNRKLLLFHSLLLVDRVWCWRLFLPAHCVFALLFSVLFF
jgi:hypothetical protein